MGERGTASWNGITWNGITPRGGEAIRRVGAILRYLGGDAGGALLRSEEWVPHTPQVVHSEDVFASKWPGAHATAYTIVNRAAQDLHGPQLIVTPSNASRYFDCYHGEEIMPGPVPK